MREQWGDHKTIETKLARRRLEWLGHLARMPGDHLPKRCLFGWLPQVRPCRGPRMRWRDVVKRDLRTVGLCEDWYGDAQERGTWRAAWSQDLREHQHT